jgi:PEP-CTERM/exosortase A-associated glycosyltransferase
MDDVTADSASSSEPDGTRADLSPPAGVRILHVLDHSVPMQSGYSFRTLGILRGQRRRGWQTFHLTTPRHTAAGPDPEDYEGFSFHRTASGPSATKPPVLRELAEIKATTARLLELARTLRPQVLHAHSPVLNALPALRVGKRLGLPVVYEVRAFWEDAAVSAGNGAEGGPRYRISRAIESHALRRADAVTTICEGLRGDMIARGIPAEKITVIPNAVALEEFDSSLAKDTELMRQHGLGDGIVLGFIGSFYAYEGLDLLIRAMPAVAARHPGARLLLVGGGPEDARLRAMVAEQGLEQLVLFTGRVPHDQVERYYSLVDIFAYPRKKMRLTDLVTPLKPLESMAMRRIVVASDVGGHRELIAPGTGYLFTADDVGSLVDALSRAIGDKPQWPQMQERAIRFVGAERSWDSVVARYEPVYRRLLAGSWT